MIIEFHNFDKEKKTEEKPLKILSKKSHKKFAFQTKKPILPFLQIKTFILLDTHQKRIIINQVSSY